VSRLKVMIGTEEIQKVLPHRYPFLLVDRIIEVEHGKRIVGIKNVSCNEPFFQGHFPGNPVMPGVLIIEAMAQVGAYAALNYPEVGDKIAYLAAVDRARFRHPVVPGDTLRIEVELIRMRGSLGKLGCSAYVEGKLVADAELTFALVDRREQ
jgi:3-hydroxyacyl-[acyl-carrier-protein] dehydratase